MNERLYSSLLELKNKRKQTNKHQISDFKFVWQRQPREHPPILIVLFQTKPPSSLQVTCHLIIKLMSLPLVPSAFSVPGAAFHVHNDCTALASAESAGRACQEGQQLAWSQGTSFLSDKRLHFKTCVFPPVHLLACDTSRVSVCPVFPTLDLRAACFSRSSHSAVARGQNKLVAA